MTGRYHLDGKICQRLINVVPARVCMRRSQSTAQLTTNNFKIGLSNSHTDRYYI